MNTNNEKVEVLVVNIIGGGCTIGFVTSIILGILAVAIPEESILLFWDLTILGINVIVGIIIRLGKYFEPVKNAASVGSMWGIIICADFTSLLSFYNGTKFEMLLMVAFCIACFVCMIKIGFGKRKNIDFRWSS